MMNCEGNSYRSPRQKVFLELRQRIAAGSLVPGQRLPTESELVENLAVSRGTVRAALTQLAESGLVEQRRGFGCYVKRLSGSDLPRTICFLVPLCSGRSLYDEILAGVEELASSAGYEVNFINSSNYMQNPAELREKLTARSIAGVIFAPLCKENYYELNSRFIDLFEHNDIRYVVIDSPVARNGIICGNFVGADGYSAMRRVVRELVSLGHRRIGSIRVFSGVYTADQRASGIIDQLHCEELDDDPALHLEIRDTQLEDQGRASIRQLMALPESPSAIICSHDTLAMNVMDELRQMGIRVPDNISIFGFDDDHFAGILKLSTVRQPFREIGRRAVGMLLEHNPNGSLARRQEFLPCELVRRQSCGAFSPVLH